MELVGAGNPLGALRGQATGALPLWGPRNTGPVVAAPSLGSPTQPPTRPPTSARHPHCLVRFGA